MVAKDPEMALAARRRHLPVALELFLCCLVPAVMLSHGSDSKITYRHSWNGHSSTTTKYYQRQGERSRLELPPPSSGYAAKPGDQITYVYGHRTVTIYQCDRRRVIDLDLDAREYDLQTESPGVPHAREALQSRALRGNTHRDDRNH